MVWMGRFKSQKSQKGSWARVQCDRIGRIFAYWTIFYFEQFFWKLQKLLKIFGDSFSAVKVEVLSLTKNGLGHILGDFPHKIIWSHCSCLKRETKNDSLAAGWPDEFVEKIAQVVAKDMFCHNQCIALCNPKMCAISLIFKVFRKFAKSGHPDSQTRSDAFDYTGCQGDRMSFLKMPPKLQPNRVFFVKSDT
jgi:hypothetical protein